MSSCKQDVSSWGPKQFEFQFFWPFTEQIKLDLDFTPCEQFTKSLYTTSTLLGGTNLSTVSWSVGSTNLTPTLQIDIDQTPITVVSKNKPSMIRKYLYKVLGIKWKTK